MPPRELLEPPAISPLERQLLVHADGQQKKPDIQTVPKSSVLSKVRSFLPQMQQANAQLEERMQTCDHAELDIEHIPEGADAKVIQMDLACGLLDLHDQAAMAAAQRAIEAGGDVADVAHLDAGTSDSSSDDDDDDSSDDCSDDGSDGGKASDAAVLGSRQQQHDAPLAKTGAASHQQQPQQEGQVAAGVSQHAGGAAEASGAQQQQQQQVQVQKRRKKVKAKRPMIIEM